ncbi:DUF222 domain-containing protein [Mycolicibacterium nivoides]|uniref:DUF222 domain-containing protein n=1 Tax=Mycolicibacterium nivoides TaxID=2487344 RepID=A0ABW9L9Z3_9MYCO
MFEFDSDVALIDRISAAARAESVAIAARLAAIGALDTLREIELAESIFWRTDPFEEVAAEVSAALRMSRGRAGTQVHRARGCCATSCRWWRHGSRPGRSIIGWCA